MISPTRIAEITALAVRLRQKSRGEHNSVGDKWGDWLDDEVATALTELLAEREAMVARVDELDAVGIKLALEAGKLNVALDGQEKYNHHRQAVVDAMDAFRAALKEQA